MPSKELADVMGGFITLQSEPHAGSMFVARLPLASEDDGPEPTAEDAQVRVLG